MKKIYLTVLILVMGLTLTACQSRMMPNKSSVITGETAVVENQLSNGILIAYMSSASKESAVVEENADSGLSSYNTETTAHMIEEITGGTMIDMVSSGNLPEDYGTLFLDVSGSSELSETLESFLEANDFSEKTIIPFGIIGESDFETLLETLYELNPNSEFLDGLSIDESNMANQQSEVNAWLSGLGYHD